MATLNGFLGRKFGEPPRLTKGQKELIIMAIKRIVENQDVRALLVLLFEAWMKKLPDDRSCFSCDLFAGGESGHCIEWKQKIPEEYLEQGCEKWKDEGAPF